MTCPSCDLPCPPDAESCSRCGLDVSSGIRRRSLVAGRYDVQGLLGVGSIATVYRALDRFYDRMVALKVFRPDVRRTAQADTAFRADIARAQPIHHRNFCPILEGGEHEGLLFLVMAPLAGANLKERLKGRSGFPPEEAFALGMQITAGLQAVHEAGLIHQDVTPQNVRVDDQGTARLMDMDVAKRWGSAGAITITSVGQLFGTPEYVSPEHARGVPADLRSDIYSLGCVLFELFTGHPPYRAATPVATALKHIHEPIPLEGAKALRIPETMLPVFRKALAKNPARRYPTARALASALGLARTMSGGPSRLAPMGAAQNPLPVLLGALNPIDATIRLDLAEIRAGDPGLRRAIPALLHALNTDRERAEEAPLAELLGDRHDPDPVRVGPEGEGPTVSFVGSAGSVAILAEALRERDGSVRAKAARALGSIGPAAREAIPVLLDALQDREAHVRWDAARALGQIGAAAAEGLAAAVNDKDPVVRQIAADALKRIIQRKRKSHSSE